MLNFRWELWSIMFIWYQRLKKGHACAWFVFHLSYMYDSLKLTHWGRVTHICVSELPIIGSNNGLSPGWLQAIIWTNAGILLIRPLGTDFSEILNEIHTFSFKKMHLKMSSAKWRPFCLGLNVLIYEQAISNQCYVHSPFQNIRTLNGIVYDFDVDILITLF